MVKPGTHLGKNHESQSKTSEFQCNQTVTCNLTTDSRPLYYSILKLKYSPSGWGGGGGVLPYMGYIGMCRCEGYGFQAFYSGIGYINQRVWV